MTGGLYRSDYLLADDYGHGLLATAFLTDEM